MGKTIIFDVSGVITEDDLPSQIMKLARDYSLDFNRALEAVDLMNYADAVVGKKTSRQMYETTMDRLRIDMDFGEFISRFLGGYALKQDMLDLVRNLNEHRLFVLSNQTPINSEYLHGVLDPLFERVFFSNEIGFRKPDPKSFQKLLDETGLRAEECIFIDDNLDNIKAAWALGFKVILFRGRESLVRDLQSMGISIRK